MMSLESQNPISFNIGRTISLWFSNEMSYTQDLCFLFIYSLTQIMTNLFNYLLCLNLILVTIRLISSLPKSVK